MTLLPQVSGARPRLAIIIHGVTPYFIHLCQEVAGGLQDYEVHTLFTHDKAMAGWPIQPPADINPVMLDPGARADEQNRPSRFFHELRKGLRIIRWLEDHRVRAVLLFGYNGIGRLAIVNWCHRNGVHLLFTSDSNIACDNAKGLKRFAKNLIVPWVFRRVDAFLPCGQRGKAFYQRYGADPNRCFYFPFVPDFAEIEGISAREIDLVRIKYGLRVGRRYLIYSGRMIPLKRIDMLIDAFASLADRRPEWDMLLIGDGELRASLEARVPPDLKHRLVWTGFLSNQRDISTLYRCADALALCSNREAWALVLIEAATAGLALISSDIPGAAPEVLRDGVNGRMFKADDPEALKAAIEDVTAPDHIGSMKAASQRIVHEWRISSDPVAGIRKAIGHCARHTRD